MILMGDEVGRTQYGNNNAYCHDNELNWLDWSSMDSREGLLRFFRQCVAFRRSHPVLRSRTHLRHTDYVGSGFADMSWHGTEAWKPDWSEQSRALAFMLCGQHAKNGTERDNHIYVALNTYWDALWFHPPQLPSGLNWHLAINTGMASPEDIWEYGHEPLLNDQGSIMLGARSVVVLVGR
jgi:glycogen operon protein